MKRLTYISKASYPLTEEDLQQLRSLSVSNNQRDHITGVLLYLKGIFFQIFEGEEVDVNNLYHRIQADPRHQEILCLKTEYQVTERQFPDWEMKTINLDTNFEVLVQPLKILLQTVVESYRIVEKYTQPSVTNILSAGTNPLTVSPRLVEKIIFFSDIVAFSTFCEKLPVTDVVTLVNQYFTICTRIIGVYGGEVNKFIGDCVMASFNPAQADAAIQASLDILRELQKLRDHAPPDNPFHWLYTGIGLSCGRVIEGNIGSLVKMDYTLLGEAVNVAARVEALTRQLSYSLALTAEVKTYCHQPHWSFVNLGQHQTKGKKALVEVYSVADDLAKKPDEANLIAKLIQFITLKFGTPNR